MNIKNTLKYKIDKMKRSFPVMLKKDHLKHIKNYEKRINDDRKPDKVDIYPCPVCNEPMIYKANTK
jgi:hypothetical protein